MILKAILRVQNFCSFGVMLFIVNLLIKTDPIVICVICGHCLLKHVSYEPFSLQNFRFRRYLVLIG